MLDRRTLLGATLAVPFVGLGEAEAATTLGEYVVLLGDGTGRAEGTTYGFRLRGGPYDDFASGIRLFSRFTLPASGTVRYRLTRVTVPPVVSNEGVWFNVGIVWGRDPAALPPDTPTGDIATAPMWKGWRITHANKDPTGTIPNQIRIKTYPDRVAITPREAKVVANFRPGVAYEVVLTWGGRVVSLAVPAMGVKQSWANDALRVPSTGARLMFYASFGGDFLVENVRRPA
jgi:hypothetical protein